MAKFHYTQFGDDVPKEIEREYNRMERRERYLEEQDIAHDVTYLDHKDMSQIPNPTAEELSPADILKAARLEYLPIALELMRMDHPFEYQLIKEYYLSENVVTMMYLAQKYALTKRTVEYRMKRARELLKKYIMAHENDE